MQAGIEPGGVCPVVFVVIDGVRVHSFHPDGATIDLICEGLDTGRVDCLNGGCIPSATYGTPGVFANLAACESGCAQNSNCTGECVSAEELAALQQAANNLRSRLCG